MKKIGIVIINIFVLACGKPESNFSEIPEIKFKSGTLKQEKDKLGNTFNAYSIILTFTDGDNNVGLREKESGKDKYINEYKNNLWIHLYKQEDKKFVKKDTKGHYDRIVPFVEGTGSPKEQDGTIEFKLEIRKEEKGSVLQFDFQLLDRKLNKSNIVKSNIITLQ